MNRSSRSEMVITSNTLEGAALKEKKTW